MSKMSYEEYMMEIKPIGFTVFPNDPDEMPQDFDRWWDAKEYGDEMFGEDNYTIEEM